WLRRVAPVVFGVLIGMSGASLALAQGTYTRLGPDGGSVNVLAVDPVTPTTVYAGTTSGLFRSADGGASWTTVNPGLTYFTQSSLAVDPVTPTTLYAANHGGVFRSADGGANWTRVGAGEPHLNDATLLAVNPMIHTTVYAGTSRSGLYRSTDAGGNWTRIDP